MNVLLRLAKENQCVWRLNHQTEKWKKSYFLYKKWSNIYYDLGGKMEWSGGHTEIYWMNRNKELAQGGYFSCSYLQTIENNPPAIWQPDLKFMENNVPIHKTNVTENWYDENGIAFADWPAYSPDFNALWAWLG